MAFTAIYISADINTELGSHEITYEHSSVFLFLLLYK